MTPRELTPQDYIAMLRRRWMLIAILALVGGPLAYGVSRFLPPKYKSQTLVLVEPPAISDKIVAPVDTTSISERLSSMRQQILSRTRLEPIIHQFGLYTADAQKTSMDALVERLQASIEVSPVMPMAETESTRLPGFFVNVTMYDPHLAQQVCAAVTSMFIEESLRVSQQHSEVTTDFLSQQLAEAKKDLDDQDNKLAAFKSRYLGALPDEEQTNLNLLTGLTSQLDAATQALGRAQQDKTFVESNLAQQLAAWQASQVGQNPETLEDQLASLQTQLVSLQARYTDDYPDVIKTKRSISAVQAQIAASDTHVKPATSAKSSLEPPTIQQLRAQIHNYEQIIIEKTRDQEQVKAQIKLYQSRVQSSPGVEEQYKELTRGYQTALDAYNELLRNKNGAEMATALQRQQEGEQFRVLDPANLPNAPSFPNRLLFTLEGFGGGLGLGLALTFLLEMRDTSLRSERDVEVSLRLPVLAMVPAIEPIMTKKSKRPVLGTGDSELGLGARA